MSHVPTNLVQEPQLSYGVQKHPLQVSLFKLIQIFGEFYKFEFNWFYFHRIWQPNPRTPSDSVKFRNLQDFMATLSRLVKIMHKKIFAKISSRIFTSVCRVFNNLPPEKILTQTKELSRWKVNLGSKNSNHRQLAQILMLRALGQINLTTGAQ
jgi:hypothetical protein